MGEALEIVGTGRTADVFEHGAGEVLRRYRDPRDTEREVAAMEHARVHGYPVPAARALSDTEIVMERIEGPTMLDDLARRPWSAPSHATTLARLHNQLHEIAAPEWLGAPFGAGDSLLHLDLHPDNVILSESGPMVIDWPNAARGPSTADVTHTWIVMACSVPTSGRYRQAATRAGSRLFVALFLRHYDRATLVPHVAAVGMWRAGHRVLPPTELAAIKQMVEKYG